MMKGVVMQPEFELGFPFLRILVRAGAGPLPQGGLDEAFMVQVSADWAIHAAQFREP
jgi:hypothetical protein